MSRPARRVEQAESRHEDQRALARREPLQVAEDSKALARAVARLALTPEQALELALDFEAAAGEIIGAKIREFLETIDASAIKLAYQHKDNSETLRIITDIQRAAHAIHSRGQVKP